MLARQLKRAIKSSSSSRLPTGPTTLILPPCTCRYQTQTQWKGKGKVVEQSSGYYDLDPPSSSNPNAWPTKPHHLLPFVSRPSTSSANAPALQSHIHSTLLSLPQSYHDPSATFQLWSHLHGSASDTDQWTEIEWNEWLWSGIRWEELRRSRGTWGTVEEEQERRREVDWVQGNLERRLEEEGQHQRTLAEEGKIKETLSRYLTLLTLRPNFNFVSAERIYRLYSSLISPPSPPQDPLPNLPASLILLSLPFSSTTSNSNNATDPFPSHLLSMLKSDHLPLKKHMIEILQKESEANESSSYDLARQILGGKSSSANLEALYESRMKEIERREKIGTHTADSFLKWLLEREWLEESIEFWDKMRRFMGRDGFDKKDEGLRRIVDKVLTLEKESINSTLTTSTPSFLRPLSPLLVRLLRLLTTPSLITPKTLLSHSHRLLHFLTLTKPAPTFSRILMDFVLRQCPPSSPHVFQFTTNSIPSFAYLFLQANGRKDDRFMSTLYSHWISSGLKFPKQLVSTLMKSLGRRASIVEIGRVLNDIEFSGEGVKESHIEGMIRSCCGKVEEKKGDIARPLVLLNWSRVWLEQRTSTTEEGRKRTVGLGSYNAVLRLLALHDSDRRNEVRKVWNQLLADRLTPSVESWNNLLGSRVFRFKLDQEDVESVETILSKVCKGGQEPDGTTYSLMVQAYVFHSIRSLHASDHALKAAQHYYNRAIEEGLIPLPEQTSLLMRALAKKGEYECAKMVSESWWKVFVEREKEMDRGVRERWMALMRTEADVVARMEGRGAKTVEEKEVQREDLLRGAFPDQRQYEGESEGPFTQNHRSRQ